MSHSAIAAAAAADALRWTPTTNQLGLLHVPFDELTGAPTVERRLIDEAARRGKVLLIGPSGCGKSSTIAGVFGPMSDGLPRQIVPIRVPILLASADNITQPLGFARHLLQHVAAWSEHVLSDSARAAAAEAAGDRRTRSAGGGEFSAQVGLPFHGIPVEAGVSIRRAATEIEESLSPTTVGNAVTQLVGAFDELALEPFFVIDDADTWTSFSGLPDPEAVARAFYGGVVNWMARDFEVGFVIVAHEEYEQISAYSQVAQLVRQLQIPRLPEPASALAQIVDRRLADRELGTSHTDVFEVSALDALATRYLATLDIRRTLQLAALAVDLANDDLTASHVTDTIVETARLASGTANRPL